MKAVKVNLGKVSITVYPIWEDIDYDKLTLVYHKEKNATYISKRPVPKGTIILGEIEKVNEPIVGTHASMVVKLTKMQLPDGFEIPIKGYIYSGKPGYVLGGNVTEPESYKKLPHYQEGLYKGTLRWIPGPTLKMGEHLTIAAGAELVMVFDKPAYITHTLTN